MDRANVLFVDDDPYFLKGIERALRGSDSGWNMAFVDNGPADREQPHAGPADRRAYPRAVRRPGHGRQH
ncbi:MAG: hypothetical protein VW405_16085, partial [Rhodospirillaceae bacterium]